MCMLHKVIGWIEFKVNTPYTEYIAQEDFDFSKSLVHKKVLNVLLVLWYVDDNRMLFCADV